MCRQAPPPRGARQRRLQVTPMPSEPGSGPSHVWCSERAGSRRCGRRGSDGDDRPGLAHERRHLDHVTHAALVRDSRQGVRGGPQRVLVAQRRGLYRRDPAGRVRWWLQTISAPMTTPRPLCPSLVNVRPMPRPCNSRRNHPRGEVDARWSPVHHLLSSAGLWYGHPLAKVPLEAGLSGAIAQSVRAHP